MSFSYTGQKGTLALMKRSRRTIHLMLRQMREYGCPGIGQPEGAPRLFAGGTLLAIERWLKRDPAKNHVSGVSGRLRTDKVQNP